MLLSSLAVLGGYLLMFWVAARAAGAEVGPLRLLPLAMLALIAMGLPLNVGGWGPREGVTAWAFGAAGLGAGTGLSVAVVYGVLSFVAALPGALVLVARWWGGLRERRAGGSDHPVWNAPLPGRPRHRGKGGVPVRPWDPPPSSPGRSTGRRSRSARPAAVRPSPPRRARGGR